jgi:RHS repeat-associated protein
VSAAASIPDFHPPLEEKFPMIGNSGASEQFVYDALGNRIGFYNAEGKPITFGFDAQGRVTAITNAIGRVTRFTYDVNGNLVDREDAKNEVTHYDYDVRNRLTNVVYQGLSRASFSYDPNGSPLNQQSAIANQQFSYDSMNRLSSSLISVNSRSFAVTNSYDLNGNRTNIVYPGGLVVGYSYDEENRLTGTVLTGSTISTPLTFSFGYDGASRMTNMVYPNGVNSSFGYDADSRVASYTHGSFINRTITRDPHGFKTGENIIQGLEPSFPEGEQRMEHNAADQLTKITQRDTWLGGELNQWYERNYSYDDNGCLTQEDVSRPEWNTNSAIHEYTVDYEWDYDNRLTAVAGGLPVSITEYIYDASGVRIGRVHNAVTNWFVIDYNAPLKMPLAETDAQGNITRYYVWGTRGLLCHLDMNPTNGALLATRYYHADELGSTLALTDANGTLTDQFAYSPYGQLLSRTGTNDTPYLWIGGLAVRNEGNGLYYMLNRYYSAEQRRFISTDPMGIDGGVNLYSYAGLNPTSYSDPFGLEKQSSSLSWYDKLYNEVLSWLAQHQQSEQNYARNTAAYYNSMDYWQYSATWAHAIATGIADVNEAIGTKLAVAAMVYSFATMPASTPMAYRAVDPKYAQATLDSGFYKSGSAGRLGNDGIYANSSVQGAVAEFQYHNPGVSPTVFEVKYSAGSTLNVNPPAGNFYVESPLPFTQGANTLSAPSLRQPGTMNYLIRDGAVPGRIIQ